MDIRYTKNGGYGMYIVEGNIGAGKSTFLARLQQAVVEYLVTLEPLYDWQHQIYGQSLLTNFYKDPLRWAYTFETLTLMCRIKEQLHDQQQYADRVHIVERSMYSGYHCFAQNSYEQGFLSEVEWQMYQQWFAFLTEPLKQPHGFIYLQCAPETCYDRIKKRNRLAEKKLTQGYVRQIHERHETFLVHEKTDVPVLVLNVDQPFEDDEQRFLQLVQQVRTFVNETR